jgi:hypothetical protein
MTDIDRLSIKIVESLDLEAPFRNTDPRWLGSDCAFSLPLPGNRVVWLFGDTFIASETTPDSRDREGAVLINNSIAMQNRIPVTLPDALNFFWKTQNSAPESFFRNEKLPGFVWPLSAAWADGKIFVFAVRIIQSDIQSAFGFEQTGNEIFCVQNPESDPRDWKCTVKRLPFDQTRVSFGAYAHPVPPYVYIYGYRKETDSWTGPLNLMIARARTDGGVHLADYNNWEYLDGERMTWFKDAQRMRPALRHSRSELSVTYLPALKRYVYIANSWEEPHPILMRVSESPFGPFSEPKIIYYCLETNWDPDYFCYAAKAHPEMATADNELVISYMVNSKTLEKCVRDTRIYYPRFIRVIVEND